MTPREGITVRPIGVVRSPHLDPTEAPKQGNEGAPDAWLAFAPEFAEALSDLEAGEDILVLTWLDRADRSVPRVHRRDDPRTPLRGVFSTRSQDRPNPIGVHRVTILETRGSLELRVSDLEALDATPILDVKPVLDRMRER